MKKLFVALVAVALLSLMFSPSALAGDYYAYVSIDKVQYTPGEQGKISILIRNIGEDPMEIKNVSIVFDNWMMYTVDGWDESGNKTIDYSDLDPIGSNKTVALQDVSFAVPTDGRATSTSVDIWIYTNEPAPKHYEDYISVVNPEVLNLQRTMDNIVTLLTLVAILAIVSAIIVAAAIFLSGRRPGVA
ncbi:MAG: hypothetical protein WCC63_07510 [Candidatus Bathyarchaeia archaeon]